jgi:hypothetical protein
LVAAAGLLATVMITTLCPIHAHAATSDPALAQILQQLEGWRASFATIRVVWHEWCRKDILESHPELKPDFEPEGNYYVRRELAWADWGAFRMEMIVYDAAQPIYRSIEGTDGARPWSCVTKYGKGTDIQQWERLQFWKPDQQRPLAWNFVFSAVLGLWKTSGHWFNDDLARAQRVSLVGYEDLDGHRCAVVKMATEETSKQPSQPNAKDLYEDTYWLDVECGHVPRKCRMLGPAMGKQGLHHWFTWSASDIRNVDHRLWFPWQGVLLAGDMDPPDKFEWVVKEVTLNESLGRPFFQAVKPTPGTKVIDYVSMRSYRAGGRADVGQREPDPASSAAPAQAVRPVEAEPPSFRWRWLGLLSAMVLLAGLLLHWRQRRRQSS